MTSSAVLARTLASAAANRRVVYTTRGHGHGPIVRLMSPSDLGEVVKPFVFLDLFEADMRKLQDSMRLHPHSGIATITVFTKGDVKYEDPQAGKGTLRYGGVEWMRASGGVWHGKEIAAGESATTQGFQLWVALPPELENDVPDSQYIEAPEVQAAGPAHVIVGDYQGVASPVRAPAGFNYLLVTLQPGETWTYTPPKGHNVGWLAIAQGGLSADRRLRQGEMAVFEEGEGDITLRAEGPQETIFVLGSAKRHEHPLHLGHYSVHTTEEALIRGEARIRELHQALIADGDRRTSSGTIPVYR